MLTHFPIGPTEDQTYMVGYETPGTTMRGIIAEHMNLADAIKESDRLNAAHAMRIAKIEKNTQEPKSK